MPSFINKQTTLDLNGPILSFVQQPSAAFSCTSGIATFVGIATATFPTQDPANPATNTGSISYNWYWEGYGQLTDGDLQGTTVTGAATTTLTLSGISSTILFNDARFFLRADYIPSAYSQPEGSDVTVGTARSTGNAINDPLDSESATLTVYPDLEIVTQPQDATVATNSSAIFEVEAKTSGTNQDGIFYQWQLNNVDLEDGTTGTFTVSGSRESTLLISSSAVSSYSIRCVITHTTACNSPVVSDTVILTTVSPLSRAILEIEAYSPGLSTAELLEFDLTNLDYTIDADTIDSDTICLYAKERDITVEAELYGAKGSNFGSVSVGGEGGYSKIRFTMKRNEEYILKGIKSKTALYLYRKAQLIACVAQGGGGGLLGNGGRGGGIGVSGENGFGRLAGNGGQLITSANLGGNGIFGSSSSATTIYAEDSKATGNAGGRTITCTKGVYWRQQGRTACIDLGTVKFRLSDGTEVTNSVAISRGFKDGYGINQTAGANIESTGGKGGNGATGGDGGVTGGGGGGSGYTDNSVTVVETTLGGNTTTDTRIVLRLFE